MSLQDTRMDISGSKNDLLRARLVTGKDERLVWILLPKDIDPAVEANQDPNHSSYRYYLHRYTAVMAFNKVESEEGLIGTLQGCSYEDLLNHALSA